MAALWARVGSGEQTGHWVSEYETQCRLDRSVDVGTERRGQIWEMFGEDVVCWLIE